MRIWQLSGVPALVIALVKSVGDFSSWQTWAALAALALFVLALVADWYWPEFWKTYLPMPDVSKQVYSHLRKRGKAGLVERWADGKDDLLISIVEQYIFSSSVDVYGKRPPSVFHEKIDKSQAGKLHFTEGGSVLAYHGDTKPLYADVGIKRWQLRRLIREIVATHSAADVPPADPMQH